MTDSSPKYSIDLTAEQAAELAAINSEYAWTARSAQQHQQERILGLLLPLLPPGAREEIEALRAKNYLITVPRNFAPPGQDSYEVLAWPETEGVVVVAEARLPCE